MFYVFCLQFSLLSSVNLLLYSLFYVCLIFPLFSFLFLSSISLLSSISIISSSSLQIYIPLFPLINTSPYTLPPTPTSFPSSNTTFINPSILCKLPAYWMPFSNLTTTDDPMMSLKKFEGSVLMISDILVLWWCWNWWWR